MADFGGCWKNVFSGGRFTLWEVEISTRIRRVTPRNNLRPRPSDLQTTKFQLLSQHKDMMEKCINNRPKSSVFFFVIIKKIIAFLTKILYHQMLHTTIGPYSVPPTPQTHTIETQRKCRLPSGRGEVVGGRDGRLTWCQSSGRVMRPNGDAFKGNRS